MIRQDISGEFATGGRSSIRPDDFEGAPERIVELAASSASYDLYDKLSSVSPKWSAGIPGVAGLRFSPIIGQSIHAVL